MQVVIRQVNFPAQVVIWQKQADSPVQVVIWRKQADSLVRVAIRQQVDSPVRVEQEVQVFPAAVGRISRPSENHQPWWKLDRAW